MDRGFFKDLPHEDLVEMCLRLRGLALEQAERLNRHSGNSSRPPSSNDPYRRGATATDAPGAGAPGDGETPAGASVEEPSAQSQRRPPGRQKGAAGKWRRSPLVAESDVPHHPGHCERCGAVLPVVAADRCASAHHVLELVRAAAGIAVRCGCGHETVARPGTGRSSEIEGRCRNLILTERCLVGPSLATFIASLALRFRLSREKIQELLRDWLAVDLSKGTICRCIREVGLACEPVAERLLQDIRAAEVVHLDETPWYEAGHLRWMWVATTATTTVFRIGSREQREVAALIGDSFLGWLVTDGYGAYRSHRQRQRCLAHLIRKGVALAEGIHVEASRFGEWLLRELRALIHGVAEDADAKTLHPIMARLKRACLLNQDADIVKARALAREILNDWDAVVAFVKNPHLPPTNNEAERALRHAVISRRISHGTRNEEGSRGVAAALSVIETCRKRSLNAWHFIAGLPDRSQAGGAGANRARLRLTPHCIGGRCPVTKPLGYRE